MNKLVIFLITIMTVPAMAQFDDEYLNNLIQQSNEGDTINITRSNLTISKTISLNQGNNLGVTLNFNGAKVTFSNSSAGFEIGQPGSGIINANIYTDEHYTGNAINVTHQNIKLRQPKLIQQVTLTGKGQNGTAIALTTQNTGEFISFLQAQNITVSGYQFGIKMATQSNDGHSFINANNFVNLIFAGNNTYDISIVAEGFSSNEISGNNFSNVQFQYSTPTESHLNLLGNAKYNNFNNIMSWDSSGRNKLLFNITAPFNTVIGYIPTSGNVASFADTTNLLIQTDAGNQTNQLRIGQRKLENSRSKLKVMHFDKSILPVLDVRNGEFFIDNNTIDNARLTNIRQGSDGQTVRVLFSGNTLLSDQWGGTGQFKLLSGSYKPEKNRVIGFTYFNGTWYEQ